MAWTVIPDSDIDPDSPITTGLMTGLRDNFAAMGAGDSGAPSVVYAAMSFSNDIIQSDIAAAAIGQGELITALQSTSTTSTTIVVVAASGGQYAFNQRGRISATGADTAQASEYMSLLGQTSFASYFGIKVTGGGRTAYLEDRYIQASPPYDLGDGEVPLFIFAVIDNATGDIETLSLSPEAPWHYNGDTDIRATRKDIISGRSWREGSRLQYEKLENNLDIQSLLTDPVTIQQGLDIINDTKSYEVEITQEIKQRDMAVIPHPFMENSLAAKTVIMLDAVSPITLQLLELHKAGENINNLLHSKHITYGNSQIPRVTPNNVMQVNLKWKNTV